MNGIAYLAWRHTHFHWLRSLTLVLVMATLITIPLLAEVLTRAAETRMMSRAEATPLIYGSAGAPLDLTLTAAYFRGDIETPISMEDYDWLIASRLADLAPVHVAGTSRSIPIIGTDFEYFRLRGLTAAAGRLPVSLGEVVLGAEAAQSLGVAAGELVTSDVNQVFDLAGAYPVGMLISGILEPTGTPDDGAILTDLKTGWIVSGLGHGHEELTRQTKAALLLKGAGGDAITANASLPTLETISADQLADFHFHGPSETFPLSAVLVFPFDEKSSALLRGRVEARDTAVQILRPTDQIRGLMENVFQVKSVLQGVMLAVSLAALLAMALVVWLSVQMRRREFDVALRLGAGPGLPAALVASELLLLLTAAVIISLAVTWSAALMEDQIAQLWFRNG
ncbi:hypothetical protein R3X27_16520 [Tropicimonas sp. TH_r6]|uniref:ABC transporter permease n=1 Tax=Tropicimonas sp. TH_r6 TaxID=3082085 RepID=UPI00295393A0|nr:ABC transporter permease [Tropicimonas sp. TH_r6]MDV7144290.1 hypothetical protein [Tropicimonas sp. TH_r6]